MSTLNRLRTNRTKLQTKVFIPFYCNSDSCSEIQGQCDACEDLDMLGAIVIVEAKTLSTISYMSAHTLQTIEKTLYDLFTISL